MAGEFIKGSVVTPAVVGTIANPDEYNANIAGQSKGSLVCIDEDGAFADGDIGDETLGTNGTLIDNIKLRDGGLLKFYNASGVFLNNVNLGQATESLIGQAEIATQAETDAGTNDTNIVTAKKLLGLFDASTLATDSCANIPVNSGGAFSKFMIQGGTFTSGAGYKTETLPQAFPNAFLFAGCVQIDGSHRSFNLDILSLSQFRAEAISVASTSVRWIAIGY